MKIHIRDSMEVWVAWTNDDKTEGKGRRIPHVVCIHKETAKRLGKREGVQGTNCQVNKTIAVNVDGMWLVPGRIIPPSKEDIEISVKKEKIRKTLEKAKELGLSDEDIKILRQIGT